MAEAKQFTARFGFHVSAIQSAVDSRPVPEERNYRGNHVEQQLFG